MESSHTASMTNNKRSFKKWLDEITVLSHQHLKNVSEFLNHYEATQNEFMAIRRYQEIQWNQLLKLEAMLEESVRDSDHTLLKSAVNPCFPCQATTTVSSFGDRFTRALERAQFLIRIKADNQRYLEILSGKVKKYEEREVKLNFLVQDLQCLTAELEDAIEHTQFPLAKQAKIFRAHTFSWPLLSEVEGDESELKISRGIYAAPSTSDELLDEYLEKTSQHFQEYCEQRRLRRLQYFGDSKRNYMRFQRSPCESLNKLFQLIETELFRLWVREDKQRLSHLVQTRGAGTQTIKITDSVGPLRSFPVGQIPNCLEDICEKVVANVNKCGKGSDQLFVVSKSNDVAVVNDILAGGDSLCIKKSNKA